MAHIVASPNAGENGAYFRTDLRVTHGCDGAATTSITVTVPKEILSIRPQMKPGWKIRIKKHALDKPVAGPHGKIITEVTDTITWSGNLPDAYFDEFGLSFKLPDNGEQFLLPVLQQCGNASRNWKDLPMTGEMTHTHHGEESSPAPVITLTPKK